MRPRCEEDRIVAELLDHQQAIARIIEEHATELLLPEDKELELQRHIIDFLARDTELGNMADARGDLLWNCTTKFHMVFHLAQRCKYLCPRRGACWIDEDFVGKCKKVAAECAGATQLHAVPEKMLEKMRWGYHLLHNELEQSGV